MNNQSGGGGNTGFKMVFPFPYDTTLFPMILLAIYLIQFFCKYQRIFVK